MQNIVGQVQFVIIIQSEGCGPDHLTWLPAVTPDLTKEIVVPSYHLDSDDSGRVTVATAGNKYRPSPLMTMAVGRWKPRPPMSALKPTLVTYLNLNAAVVMRPFSWPAGRLRQLVFLGGHNQLDEGNHRLPGPGSCLLIGKAQPPILARVIH